MALCKVAGGRGHCGRWRITGGRWHCHCGRDIFLPGTFYENIKKVPGKVRKQITLFARHFLMKILKVPDKLRKQITLFARHLFMKILKVPGKVRKQITLFCQAFFYGPILTAQQKMASFHSAALHIDPYVVMK